MNEQLIVGLLITLGTLFLLSNIKKREEFDINKPSKCPNKLVKHQGKLYMKTPQKTVEFENLKEYKYFVKALRHKGVRCPILYQETIGDTQGNMSIKRIDDPETQTSGLMPVSADNVVKTNNGLSNHSRRKDLSELNIKTMAYGDDNGKYAYAPKPFDPQNQEE
jgi:hypothetical protein